MLSKAVTLPEQDFSLVNDWADLGRTGVRWLLRIVLCQFPRSNRRDGCHNLQTFGFGKLRLTAIGGQK
jgi:hypothetical protein